MKITGSATENSASKNANGESSKILKLVDRGYRQLESNDLRGALLTMQRCTALAPWLPEGWFNLALALYRLGKLEKAEDAFHRVLALNPGHAGAMEGLGLIADEQKRPERAAIWFCRSIRADPGRPAPWVNLGNLLRRICKPAAACGCLERAIRLAPESGVAFCNLGNAYRDLGRFDRAEACYRHALKLNPAFAQAHFNLAMVLLQQGRLEEGWPHYQWRLKFLPSDKGYPNRHGLELWRGQDPEGKRILVYDEQGFGDVLLFARYLPLLKKQGAGVVLETRAELRSLFLRQPYLEQVLDRNRSDRSRSDCHWCTPIASLPMLFGTKMDSIPADIPYIAADERKTERAGKEIKRLLPPAGHGSKPLLKIGLTWKTTSSVDRFRSIGTDQLALLAGLCRHLPLAFYGLQKDNCQTGSCPQWIIPLDDMLTDFDQTAAVLENLDLVITIDTAVAHLAGAMGRPVWVMLPKNCDWRWFLGTSHSPWYPTMRLFRQSRPNHWQPVLKQVAACLEDFVNKGHSKNICRISCFDDNKIDENPRRLFRQAVEFEKSGHRHQAIRIYTRLAAQNRDPGAAANYNLGLIMLESGNPGKAAEFFSRALELAPQLAQAANNLGCALEMLNRNDQALAAYKKALEIDPAFSGAAYNLGRNLTNRNRLDEAARAFRQAIESDPDNHRAANNLGAVLHRLGQLDQALDCFNKALELKPDFAKAYQNLGNVYLDLNKPEIGIACHAKALEIIEPTTDDYIKQAQLCIQWLKLDQAEAQLHQALKKDPGHALAHTILGTLHLLQGDLASGWKKMQWRFKLADRKARIYPHIIPDNLWQGEQLYGRSILVHCEQGLGDTIQFIRYLPMLQKKGARVTVEVQAALSTLVSQMQGISQAVVLGENPYDVKADFHVFLLDLPGIFGTDMENIPNKVPYLHPRQDKIAKWQRRLDSHRLKVGLVWQGSSMHPKDSLRSMQFGQLLPLLGLEDIEFFSLQKPEPGRSPVPRQRAVKELGPELEDFGDTAAVISMLDLVISVDTAVAHLAGALAKPVWVMLPFSPDWRWQLDRTDSPWYPTMRLFRQHRPEDWSRVVWAVKNNLQSLARQRRSCRC